MDEHDAPESQDLYAWSQKPSDLFVNVEKRELNYAYFRPYFETVSLPPELAQTCLADLFAPQGRGDGSGSARQQVLFMRGSTLRDYTRLPSFNEVRYELVDARRIADLQLRSGLSIWGADDSLSENPCIFVSHRWESRSHPDPNGTQLRMIFKRLKNFRVEPSDVYLWIDYCCAPQRGRASLKGQERLRTALRRLPEIVMSCDLMVLWSPDYLSRAWCHTELVTWLCKVADIGFMVSDNRTKALQVDSDERSCSLFKNTFECTLIRNKCHKESQISRL